MSRLFDSHAHLSSAELYPRIDEIMSKGVYDVINICTDKETMESGLELVKRYARVRNAGATTPHYGLTEHDPMFDLFANLAREQKLVAIGETGLEYFLPGLDHNLQKKYLVRYLHLAEECKLPVIFHCRDAFVDLFEITKGLKQKAILHCFTGTIEEAEKVLERGWYLSLSGIVTFKKSAPLREVAKMVPMKQLLIETDAPYLAPQSKRGQMNEPAFIEETARIIAEIKGVSFDAIARSTFENASCVFSL